MKTGVSEVTRGGGSSLYGENRKSTVMSICMLFLALVVSDFAVFY